MGDFEEQNVSSPATRIWYRFSIVGNICDREVACSILAQIVWARLRIVCLDCSVIWFIATSSRTGFSWPGLHEQESDRNYILKPRPFNKKIHSLQRPWNWHSSRMHSHRLMIKSQACFFIWSSLQYFFNRSFLCFANTIFLSIYRSVTDLSTKEKPEGPNQ